MSESELVDMDEEMESRDDDSFSNSPEGSSDEEDADEEKIAELQKQINASPYTYELHVQLITLYRKLGDLDHLRIAREKMSEIFPLTPELWLDWLTDEKTLATTPEQKEKLVELFERSVRDYASVSVWLEYVQFSIGNIGDSWSSSGLEVVRQTFERAITAVGIHVTQGCLIWEAYREFETVYLMSLRKKDVSEEEIKEQENRIFNLFKRQLSIPLLDMDKTFKEFQEFFGDSEKQDLASIEYAYNKAVQKLNKLQEYEENLFGSEGPHYEEYKAYVEFEKQEGEPVRVQNIFERAVVENCLKEDLWLDYTKYMDRVVKIPDMSLLVYERAVRNCPWSLQLWLKYGRALERYEQPHEKIIKVFETALTMGFSKEDDFREIWLGYLDYLRRRTKIKDDPDASTDLKEIVDVFDRAITQMEQYFWGSESQYVIVKYWIFFTAKYKKDIASARQWWKDLIVCGHKEEARVWLDYANFEKVYGDVTHYRRALLNALSSVTDWPETFVDLLLTFEREEGTLESFEKSEEKCESEMKIINQKRMKKMEENYSMRKEDRRGSKSKRQSHQSKNPKQENSKSDSNIPVQMDSEGFKIPPPPDKFLHASENRLENHSSNETENRKRRNEESDLPEPKKKNVEVREDHGITIQHDSSKDDRTVFLSNLSYDADEEKIRNFSSPVGEIEEVRLVKDFKGRSKGYCYVVYKSELDAKKALERDREKLDGRPVLISPCEDRKNSSIPHSKLKFSAGLEKNKVFVKHIPYSTTEQELEELFKEYGSLKSVRVVTFRNGHSKGLAYIEYEDEESASDAVRKMDGTQIGSKVISCAISNPPPRKPRNEFLRGSFSGYSNKSSSNKDDSRSSKGESSRSSKDESSNNKASGSSSRASNSFNPRSGGRGRGRTQLSMLPRAIARPASGNKNVPNSSTPLQNGQKSDSTDSTAEHKPLTNSDFANMLKK